MSGPLGRPAPAAHASRAGAGVNGHGGPTDVPSGTESAGAIGADSLTRVQQPDPPADLARDPWAGLVTETHRLQPALDALRASVAGARSRVTAAAQESRQSARLAAGQARQEAEGIVTALTAQLAVMGGTARGELQAGASDQRAAVTAAVTREQQTVRGTVTAEADRFTAAAAEQSGNVRSLAERQRQDAATLGTSSAERARTQAEAQAQAAEEQGRAAASSYHDDDPDRSAAMAGAARQVAAAQAQDIREAAPDLAHGAQEQAGRVGTSSTDHAQQATQLIDRSAPTGRAAILDLGAGAAAQMSEGSRVAQDGLGRMSVDLIGGLTDLFETLAGRVRELHRTMTDQVSVVERAVLDQVDTVEAQAHQRVDQVATEAAVRLAARRGRVHAAGLDVAGPVADSASAALAGLAGTATDHMGTVIAEGRTAAAAIELHGGQGAQTVVAGQRTSSASVVAYVGQTLAQTTTATAAGAASSASEMRTGNQQLADQAAAQMTSGYTQASQQVTSTVDGGLQQNMTAVNQLGAHIGDAADRAAEEYDRPWWKKALYAIGTALLYLAAAIIATLILAVVIWAAAALLAAAGLITAISFAAALGIAVLVGAAAYFLYECYSRAQAYRAEHGPTHGFWQTLGVTVGIVTASAFSVIGVTQIIEGARRKRFFSDRQMTPQEQYDSIIGGALALILTLVGGRLFGRGVPRPEPGPVLDPGGGPRPADPIPTVDPNAPRPVDPVRPAEPGRDPDPRPVDPVPEPVRPYDPATRTDAELITDRDPVPRAGETAEQAQGRTRAAEAEIELRRAMGVYNSLGDRPPRIDMRANDAAHPNEAHTFERHGPDIPLHRAGAPPGTRTIEGRIFGDPPWPNRQNASYRWVDEATLNRVVNEYFRNNWDTIRSDLATEGVHERTFDRGSLTGEGFSNANQGTPNPPVSVEGRTSMVTITIELVPGSNPPVLRIVRTFPNGRGF